jgi:hypothetical protein
VVRPRPSRASNGGASSGCAKLASMTEVSTGFGGFNGFGGSSGAWHKVCAPPLVIHTTMSIKENS